MKKSIAILGCISVLVCSAQFAHAKGASASGGRSSVSTSSARSVSRPATTTVYKPVQATKVRQSPVIQTSTPSKRKERGEYEYFELRDCTRIVKPINGYRCFDRD